MDLKMSAVSPKVAEFWEFTEREARGKCELYLRSPPMARGRVQASALLEPRFQVIEQRFRSVVLDALPRPMQRIALNACLLGVAQSIFEVFVGAGLGSRADKEQTLLRVQCPASLSEKSTLDNLFDWKFLLTSIVSCE